MEVSIRLTASPLELAARPLEMEQRVPAAALRVVRIERQRALERLLRHRTVVVEQ